MQHSENGSAPGAGEAEAWAEVVAGWDDDARHRAYLDRAVTLDALAVAGRRYRDALAARPDDPVALRGRDEVVRRATVAGLAMLPRTKPGWSGVPRRVRSLVIAVGIAALVGCAFGVADLAFGLFSSSGVRP